MGGRPWRSLDRPCPSYTIRTEDREVIESAILRRIAARIVVKRRDETSRLPVIDAPLALGRLTGLTGKDEILWLRACLEACTTLTNRRGTVTRLVRG
jgi:hypothetical protein